MLQLVGFTTASFAGDMGVLEYSRSCARNLPGLGMDTTRMSLPEFRNSAAAPMARLTSEPVAMMMASGVPTVSRNT